MFSEALASALRSGSSSGRRRRTASASAHERQRASARAPLRLRTAGARKRDSRGQVAAYRSPGPRPCTSEAIRQTSAASPAAGFRARPTVSSPRTRSLPRFVRRAICPPEVGRPARTSSRSRSNELPRVACWSGHSDRSELTAFGRAARANPPVHRDALTGLTGEWYDRYRVVAVGDVRGPDCGVDGDWPRVVAGRDFWRGLAAAGGV